MKQNYYTLMLFFALTIGLASCGGSKKTNNSNTKDSTSSSSGQSGDQADSGNNEARQKMSEAIQTYCNKFNEGKYLEVEPLFAAEVSQYISMKNTKAATIAKEVNRFLTKKSGVDYFADFAEMKVNGKTVTVPLNITWSGYETRVLTEVSFDDAYKITSLKETKVLKQKYTKKLQTAKKQVVKAYENCDFKSTKGDCPYALFDYVLVSEAANNQVKEAINSKIYALMQLDAKSEADLQKNASEFVNGFAEAVKSGSVMGTWYTNTTLTLKESKNFATVTCFSEAYAGGAHGNSSINIAHFDLNTGKELTLADMLIDNALPELRKIATTLFRKQNQIQEGKSIEASGYAMNDNEKFRLAKGFTFKSDRIEFWYGRYEAGPYSMPPPMLSIKYADIKHLIKKDGLLGHKVK